MAALPTGTVTFLFTDIKGSTELMQRLGERRYTELLQQSRHLLRTAFQEHGGHEIDARGEEFFVAFASAKSAVLAALAGQRAIGEFPWPEGVQVRVRMALHTGEPVAAGGAYVGLDVHRAARICSVGHGGQILISHTTFNLVAGQLPQEIQFRDLGEHRLKDLLRPERLFQVLHPSLTANFPPLRSLGLSPNNLPVQLTSFIGREKEMAEVKRLLGLRRLLTLTGLGGCGKTRLAIQVAAELLEEFPDGVWLVELAPLTDPSLIPQTVAKTLGVPEEAGRTYLGTLVDYLGPRHLLLVLDNCEHLVEACAHLAETLLRATPRLKIVVTSRQRLGVAGETMYAVPSLSLPDLPPPPIERLAESEAVRLFLERAAHTHPGFAPTNATAPVVAQIVRTLDGIPLAIELAAAKMTVLSITQIAERLDDRFRLLTGGARTLPRHQTLRATMDWSYDLLSEPERILLRRLSVFAGTFTLEAVEGICGGDGASADEVLDLLTHLVDKSLVMVDRREAEARYRLQDIVREYAREKLDASDQTADIQRRHQDWFLALAERTERILRTGESLLNRLEDEHDNFRAALENSLRAGEALLTLRMATALARFWQIRGYWTEGRRWLEAALARSADTPPALRAWALSHAAALAQFQGDYAQARALTEQSLGLQRTLGDHAGMAASLSTQGNIAYHQGDYRAAEQLHIESRAHAKTVEDKGAMAAAFVNLAIVADHQGDFEKAATLCKESLRLFREVGDKRGTAHALSILGTLASDQGDYATARPLFEESLALNRHLGERRGIAASLSRLAFIAREQGDLPKAQTLFEESLAIRHQLGQRQGIAIVISNLGLVAWRRGDIRRAAAYFKESLTLLRELGDKAGIAACLEGLARVATDPGVAARLLGAAAVLRESIHAPLPPSDRPEYDRHLGMLRNRLGGEVFAARWYEGQAMPTEQAITYALAAEISSPDPSAA